MVDYSVVLEEKARSRKGGKGRLLWKTAERVGVCERLMCRVPTLEI